MAKEWCKLTLIAALLLAMSDGVNGSNFAGKLLGKTNEGKLLFGYARLYQ